MVFTFREKVSAIRRSGAKPDDLIYVTGILGDSAARLAILKNKLLVDDINDKLYLIERHYDLHLSCSIYGKALLEYASKPLIYLTVSY